MKLINILLVTSMFLMTAAGGNSKAVNSHMNNDGGNEIEPAIGLHIRLDFEPGSWSGSILFERGPEGGESDLGSDFLAVRDEEGERPSLARSVRDRFKALRIIARVAVRLMEKAVVAFV